MYNDILDAVARKLNELFGDSYIIHTDPVEQGFKGPCFFVELLEASEKPMIGGRYYRSGSMCIQYVPGEVSEISKELNRVADLLMDGLEYITLAEGSLLRGTKRSHKTENGTLSFFTTFHMFVVREKTQEDTMEVLEANTGVRE